MKVSTDQLILRLIKCYSVFLIVTGVIITLTPLFTYIYAKNNPELQDVLRQFPNSSLGLSGVLFALLGGYCILVAIGYWRKKLWGPAAGVFILVLAILLVLSESVEWAPQGLFKAIGLVIIGFHTLPIFVWKHYYNLDKIDT